MQANPLNQYSGKLIAVEGLDGSGKSIQLYLVKRWLELGGYRVFFTEWNSSDLVKKATKRGKKQNLLNPTTFSLIHATDFADRYERQILPLLRAGFITLADRYIFTAFARDEVRGCSKKWLRNLYGFAPIPDLIFYFKLPPEIAYRRMLSARPKLKYYEAGMDLGLHNDIYESFKIFQGNISEKYNQMSEEFGFIIVDANQPVEKQQGTIRGIISENIDLSKFKIRGTDRS
ncbi:MAG: thymidylate kinase [Candidatus Marinimicrobia bacterium]|nr:thymidylate kinase [Candidatus Neomarinimicrobiota bacterium]